MNSYKPFCARIWRDTLQEQTKLAFSIYYCVLDHLCGLVIRVPGYRTRGPGSIPSATRFSEK
jgi:hypothetical protein